MPLLETNGQIPRLLQMPPTKTRPINHHPQTRPLTPPRVLFAEAHTPSNQARPWAPNHPQHFTRMHHRHLPLRRRATIRRFSNGVPQATRNDARVCHTEAVALAEAKFRAALARVIVAVVADGGSFGTGLSAPKGLMALLMGLVEER